MKKFLLSILTINLIFFSVFAKTEITGKQQQPRPFLFMENKGQIHDPQGNAVPSVLFTVSENDFKAQLTPDGIHYSFQKVNNPEVIARMEKERRTPPAKLEAPKPPDTTSISYTIQRIDMQLLGANPHPQIITEGRSDYYENYYTPGCGEKGVTGVHGYTQITYQNIYNGIDWVVYAKDGRLKYDFIVHGGADAAQIKIRYTGADGLTINKDGSFTAATALGKIIEEKPFSFIQSSKENIPSKYVLAGNVLSFAIQRSHETLVIDPSIDWGTYFYGNGSYHWQNGLYADGVGGVYISGYTNSTTNMATTGAYQTTMNGIYDAYIAKFSSAGVRLWATYYGGPSQEYWNTVSGDGGTNIYLTGYTYSTTGIATTGAYQTVMAGGYDCYLAKFTSAGMLTWATYYGGSNYEYSGTAVSDGSGNIYMGGYTASSNNISTAGSYQTTLSGGNDAFLVKFTSAGVRLWATYFGGTDTEWGNGVAINSVGDVYLSGTTSSTSGIATAGSFQSVYGGGSYDAYLAKFSPSGTLYWSTYFGGSLQDGYWGGANYGGKSLKCDIYDNVYLSMSTWSTSGIATAGAYQTSLGGINDMFLVKFNGAGARLWGTYYGGSNYEYNGGIATDNTGNSVYLSGNTTSSTGIATPGAYQTVYMGGTYDGCFAKFDAAGQLIWGSYFGGTGYEWGAGIEYEVGGYFYLGGSTSSTTNIATTGGFQNSYSGFSYDGYLARFADSISTLQTSTMPLQYCEGDSIHIPFHGVSYFGTGNVFTAQLSDASGSFGAPVVLGTKNSNAPADTIHALLPLGVNGTGYKVRVLSSLPFLISDTLSLIINPLVSPTVTIAASSPAVCAGGSLTFTATVTNGGALPLYQWIKNGAVVSTGATYTATGGWQATDSVYCIVTGNAPCTLNPIDTSNVIHINLLPAVVPTVTIASAGLVTCPGQSVTFTATATTPGTAPVYQWKKNGVNVGGNNPIFTNNNFVNGDVITCELTSNDPCASPATVTSNSLTISITLVQPTITISSSGLVTCPGQMVSFTSVISNGGVTPAYQWKKNGVNVGTNNATYTANSFVNGDVITCVVTSSNPCAVPASATSNALTISITTVVPTIQIAANDTFFCFGRPATFTVTSVTSAGTQPQYQWMKNGIGVGPNAPVYKDSFFVSGDVISCRLTSNNACAVPAQVVSNLLPLNVSAILNPIIIRVGNTLKVNVSVNPSFVYYQWYINNSPIPGATNQTTPITQNGMYQVWVTDTSGCKTVSAIAWIQDLDVNSSISKEFVKVYPNPTTGVVTIDAPEKLNVTVRNTLGQIVLNEGQTKRIDISPLAAGVYMLILSDKEGKQVTTIKLTKTD